MQFLSVAWLTWQRVKRTFGSSFLAEISGRERRGEAVELGAPRPNGVIHSILFYHRFTIHMGGRLVTCWLPADEDRARGSCLLERLVIAGRQLDASKRRDPASTSRRVEAAGIWRRRAGDRATAESGRDLWTCPAHVRGRWFVSCRFFTRPSLFSLLA